MSRKYKEVFSLIATERNAYEALRKTRLGKEKYKAAAIRFTECETHSMAELLKELRSGEYRPGPYNTFTVYEPKERVIYAPSFRDKVVQHMIHAVLKEIYQPCFIADSYACIEGRGTHGCVERIGHFLRKAKWQHGDNAYIAKLDIRKFFYSIDREVLKALFRKKITCRETLSLLDKVVDSSPSGERGLPLGNLTSQMFANLYLNEFDQYAKRVLKVKRYVRYADDIIAVLGSKEEAQMFVGKAHTFLTQRLHLELNAEKSKIFPIAQGVNAIGFKNYPTHRLLRCNCKCKIKRKLKAFPGLYNRGKITAETVRHIVNSWYGHARYADSFRFTKKLESKFSYLRFADNQVHLSMEI